MQLLNISKKVSQNENCYLLFQKYQTFFSREVKKGLTPITHLKTCDQCLGNSKCKEIILIQSWTQASIYC